MEFLFGLKQYCVGRAHRDSWLLGEGDAVTVTVVVTSKRVARSHMSSASFLCSGIGLLF